MSAPRFSLSDLLGGHAPQARALATGVGGLAALGGTLTRIAAWAGAGVGWQADRTAAG